jgi:glycosyltransferase involved in cell wall biosynthesis
VKILGVIDGLGSGGAQRQFTYLLSGLAKRGNSVSACIYHPAYFFREVLAEASVDIKLLDNRSKVGRIFSLARQVDGVRPDAVVAFLNTPNLLAESSKLITRHRFSLIVSERSFDIDGPRFATHIRLLGHRLAHRVVTNSLSQATLIRECAPGLASRVVHIPNCVDLHRFSPSPLRDAKRVRICVVASITQIKNPIRLFDALAEVWRREPNLMFECDWYGDPAGSEKNPVYVQLMARIRSCLPRNGVFRVHPPVAKVEDVYRSSDVLCLPSIYEGLPNVVCEAMACGLPILASDLGDNPYLVRDGVNGFLFDPHSTDSMAAVIQKFCGLAVAERAEMGRRSTEMAQSQFSQEHYLDSWSSILRVN